MKNLHLPMKKIFHVHKAFDRKNNSHADTHSFWKRLSAWRGGLPKKICHKKSTSPVKKSR